MMKMDTSYQSGGRDDQTLLTSLEWTDDEKAALTESIIADGRFLLPAGDLFLGFKEIIHKLIG